MRTHTHGHNSWVFLLTCLTHVRILTHGHTPWAFLLTYLTHVRILTHGHTPWAFLNVICALTHGHQSLRISHTYPWALLLMYLTHKPMGITSDASHARILTGAWPQLHPLRRNGSLPEKEDPSCTRNAWLPLCTLPRGAAAGGSGGGMCVAVRVWCHVCVHLCVFACGFVCVVCMGMCVCVCVCVWVGV